MIKSKGFTLVETLIAGLILFMILSVATMIYRNAISSSIKAQDRLTVSKSVPFLIEKIQLEIRRSSPQQSSLNGKGILLGTDFDWQANVIENGSPPAEFDPITKEYVVQSSKFKLWLVSVSISSGSYTFKSEYNELSW